MVIASQVATVGLPDHDRSRHVADGGPLRIGFVNNMPDAAFEDTYRQFAGLLRGDGRRFPIELRGYCLARVPRGESARSTASLRYEDVGLLYAEPPDALIVTGLEPGSTDLSAEPYWEELARLLRWAEATVPSTLLSCLASHAAALALDGVARVPLPAKQCGVFTQPVDVSNPLGGGLGTEVAFPHSRFNDVPGGALSGHGYQLLVASDETGWTVATREKAGRLMVLLQGHPEYAPTTLLKEYRRDVRRFLEGSVTTYPALPVGYLDSAGAQLLEAFRVGHQRTGAATEDCFPFDALIGHIAAHWGTSAQQLFDNWLAARASTECVDTGAGRAAPRSAMSSSVPSTYPWAPDATATAPRHHVDMRRPRRPDGVEALELILGHAEDHPTHLAVQDDEESLTYGELRERVTAVAAGLSALGVTPGDRVALRIPNSAGFVAAALGCLSIGAPFVPLAADDPPARHARILESSAPRLSVCGNRGGPPARTDTAPGIGREVGMGALLAQSGPAPSPASDARRDAYLIYTSGTTGEPKGVRTPQNAFTWATVTATDILGLDSTTRTLCVSPFHFDGSYGTAFPTLIAGGSLVIPRRDELLYLKRFFRAVLQEDITHSGFSPSYLRLLLASPGMAGLGASGLKSLGLGGEESRAPRPGQAVGRSPGIADIQPLRSDRGDHRGHDVRGRSS